MESRSLFPGSQDRAELVPVLAYMAGAGFMGGFLYKILEWGGGHIVGEWLGRALPAAVLGGLIAKGVAQLSGDRHSDWVPVNIASAAFGMAALFGFWVFGPRAFVLPAVLSGAAGGVAIALATHMHASMRLPVGLAAGFGYSGALLANGALRPEGEMYFSGFGHLFLWLFSYFLPFGAYGAIVGLALFFSAPLFRVKLATDRQGSLYDYDSEGMRSDRPVPEVRDGLSDGQAIAALTCPQCGASLEKDRRTRRQECPYCGSTLIVK